MTHTITATKAERTARALELNDTFKRLKPVLDAVDEAIAAAGPAGISSGHLYAMLMGYMPLGTYNAMIHILLQAGHITQVGHVLRVKQ